MWKVLLGFLTHRAILLFVALAAANYSIVSKAPPEKKIAKVQSIGTLFAELAARMQTIPEIDTANKLSQIPAKSVFTESHHPYFWFVRWFSEVTQMGPLGSVLLLSNLFFIFFVFETFVVLSAMVLLETATWGSCLLLVFPSSYEISIGSSLSLTLCLLAVALRRALDNQWFITGLALALAGLGDWVAIGWLPLFAVLFWYFQRHFQVAQVIKRLIFFLLPLTLVVVFRWEWYSQAFHSLPGSALASLVAAPQLWVSDLASWNRLPMSGPVLSLIVFGIGGILCLASHTTWLNRVVPLYSIAVVLAFSSINTISVRLLLAGTALAGIAHVSSGTLARVLSALFTLLTGAEIVRIVSGA